VKRREKQEEREKENDAPRYPNPQYGSWIEKSITMSRGTSAARSRPTRDMIR